LGAFLEPDGKAFGEGYTRPDGTVAVDHSLTLRYPTTLALLTHEGYHVMAPNELTPQTSSFLGVYQDAAAKIPELRQRGRTLPKTTAAGVAERKQIADGPRRRCGDSGSRRRVAPSSSPDRSSAGRTCP